MRMGARFPSVTPSWLTLDENRSTHAVELVLLFADFGNTFLV